MSLQDIIDKRNEYNALMQNEGKQTIIDAIKPIFDKYKDLKAIRFPAYTMYFNDGDTCYYTIYEPEILVESYIFTEHPEFKIYEDLGEYDDKLHKRVYETESDENLHTDLNGLYIQLQEISDLVKLIFDDHKLITIHRNLDVEVEDYEHD